MNNNLLEKLRKITEEEQRLLEGRDEINQALYNMEESGIIDAKSLLREGRLIDLRTHTRFAHFPKHSHNYVEVVYMVSGMTRHLVNNQEVILREGELLFMNQHATQEIYPARENDIAVNLIILPEFFDHVLPMINSQPSPLSDFIVDSLRSESGAVDYLHYQVANILPIQNLMEDMIWMLMANSLDTRQLYQTTIGLVFLHLMNYTDKLSIGGKKYEESLMVEVFRHIEEHYRDGELTDVADRLDIDLYTLSRIIKKSAGQNYTDLVQKKRLQIAASLLTTTTLSINDISLDVGYNNFSYFYKIFKKEYGLTPRQYRLIH